MYRKLFTILLTGALAFLLTPHTAEAQTPIRGPWLWMIAPTEAQQGGQKSTNVDSLSAVSGGTVTETSVATNGAQAGNIVGSYAWTAGTLPENGDINAMLVDIGMTTQGNLDDHTSYALITIVSQTDQRGVAMGVSSDDSIKVWLNGEVVHTNAINRGRGGIPASIDGYQDKFSINLNRGNNLLMVKVSERGGGCGQYVGINANVTYRLPDDTTAQTPVVEMPIVDHTDPSLILYFSFDELNGNQTIDHSQYQNHGTLVGNPQLVDGRFGKALKLNGETDWVEVPHHDSLTVDQDVTVMAWIHTPRYHGPGGALWQGIVGKSNNPRSYSFYTEADGQLHLSVSTFIGSSSEEKIALNAWQHVVAQVDSGWHRYWINGRNVGNFQIDASLPGKADTASVLIGNTRDTLPANAPDRQFLGLIDEVKIYNRALSETEILQQMGQGLQPKIEPEQGLGIFETATLPEHGLRAEAFYPGSPLNRLPDFDTLTPFLIWSVASINVPSRTYTEGFPALSLDVLENFAIRFQGHIKIETAGTYNFKINSDDGAQLYINDELIVDNDGLQAFTTATGSVILNAGFHDVELQYFQGPRAHIGLQWFWRPPGGAEAIVPPEVLYQPRTGEIPETVETATILSFSPSPVPSPTVGQQLTLGLNITGGENVAGYQVTLQFDATTLRFVSSENGDVTYPHFFSRVVCR